MDHVVIPLDGDHVGALGALSRGLAAATGVPASARTRPHVTVVAYTGLSRPAARDALEPAVGVVSPFVLHAHGFGFFSGDDASDLSLHVQVVRTEVLDGLHEAVATALEKAGAEVAGWSRAEQWSPHITLLDRDLHPDTLGAGAAWLAQRHHPSWRVRVDRLLVTGGWRERGGEEMTVPLGPAPTEGVSSRVW